MRAYTKPEPEQRVMTASFIIYIHEPTNGEKLVKQGPAFAEI